MSNRTVVHDALERFGREAGMEKKSGVWYRRSDETGAFAKGPFSITEFDTPEGLASPIRRSNPGFVPGGRTAGGAREYDLPNMRRSDLRNPQTREVP